MKEEDKSVYFLSKKVFMISLIAISTKQRFPLNKIFKVSTPHKKTFFLHNAVMYQMSKVTQMLSKLS